MKKFTFEINNNIKEEYFRLIRAQTEFILDCIRNEEMDLNEKIHEIRKSLKKIRAILRLYRDSIGYSTYHRANVFYRDLGRKISLPRDKQVLLQFGQKIIEQAPENIRNHNTEKLIATLEKHREDSLSEIKKNKVLETIEKELQKTNPDHGLVIKNEGFKVIKGGVKRIYKQARKYMNSILKDSDNSKIHDFRKRVKYLRYQMSILRPIYPVMINAYRRTLKNISDDIGLYRDYTLFHDMMLNYDFFNLNDNQREFINGYIKEEKEKAFVRALEPSKKFFLDTSGSFVKKLSKYYQIKTSMNEN